MWIKEVRLTDFRSYEHVEVDLAPGITTFVGANGQGKTNLVEAIGYASVLGSHRVATDAPLVRIGAERAVIGVELSKDERTTLLELELNPGRANRARLNRSPVPRPRELVGLVRTVMFAPEDLALVKGDPSDRRRFVDELLVQRTPRMQGVKADYDRILKQRNALLKSAAAGGADRGGSGSDTTGTLDVWDGQLADAGAELIAARLGLLDDLRPHLAASYEAIAGGADAVSDADLTVGYVSGIGSGVGTGIASAIDADTDRDAIRDLLITALERRRREELVRGLTLVGPHRDDLLLSLGGGPAKGFASHGESWSIALSLRISALEVMRTDGDEPVLILDDVFAELDEQRRSRLTARVVDGTQVLITAAVAEDVPKELAGRRLRVTKGQVHDA